jgi:uncharacterized protein YkwD
MNRLIPRFHPGGAGWRLVLATAAVSLALVPSPGTSFDRQGAERELIVLTNADRTSNGLVALRPHDGLTSVARGRSEDMANRTYFGHEIPPGGRYFEDLLDEVGIRYRQAGENIARNNFNERETTRRAQTGFMNSPPHRANILEPGFRELGIGAWDRSDNMRYFTVLFMLSASEAAQTPTSGTLLAQAPDATRSALGAPALARLLLYPMADRAPDPLATAAHRALGLLLGPPRVAAAQEPTPVAELPAGSTDAESARVVRRGPPAEPPQPPPASTEIVAGRPASLGLLEGIIMRVLKLYLSV